MRLLFCLSLMFLFTGCAAGVVPQWLTPPDQQIFVQGMEEFDAAGGEPEAFAALQEDYPDSPWTAKAQTIQTLMETIQKQQKAIRRLKNSQAASNQQNQKLLQQIESLENDLETLEAERTKLRQLLIELEQRDR